MVKLANFVIDEKFIDSMIERHDVLSEGIEHHYLYVSNSKNCIFKYIKNTSRIEIIKPHQIINYLKDNKFEGVFLHSFCSCPARIIVEMSHDIIVFWMAWGFDIYKKELIDIPLYHPITQKYRVNNTSVSLPKKIEDFLKRIKRYLTKKTYYRALKRIDYFSGVLPVEYGMMRETGRINACEFSYNYSSINRLNKENGNMDEPNCSKNILIGNSADSRNNHLDVIYAMSNIDLFGRKVYMPLSYAGTIKYRDKVINEGNDKFGKDIFAPLTDFMDSDKYTNIVKSCGYCIFMHERQQAMGNINMSLRIGSKVFLSKTSVAYKYYTSIGIHLRTIQDDLNYMELNTPLSIEEAQENYEILSKLYTKESETQILNNIKQILENNKR